VLNYNPNHIIATVDELFGDADDISSDEEDKTKRSDDEDRDKPSGSKDQDSQVRYRDKRSGDKDEDSQVRYRDKHGGLGSH
jgi:hypothetical protein